ncbi:MAG TPA: protein-glutamate O-methyltransferase CheR [Polyangiaceae bacterium]
MTPGLDRSELERLRVVVADQLGLSYEDDRLDQLADAARERMARSSAGSFEPYLQRLCSPVSRDDELSLLAEQLTVTETFFFRNPDQFRAFVDVAVLGREGARAGKRLRVLSAGCASGEEPYSLAIALFEAIPDLERWDVRIDAVDVNRAMLAKAERARYSSWSLRGTPDAVKARYFRREGRDFVLDPAVQELVEFEERNLAGRASLSWASRGLDAIFCRNVLMYFTPHVMRRVVESMRDALAPGGHLFLGHAETLRGLSHAYHLCHTHSTFYYQRRDAEASAPQRASARFVDAPLHQALPDAIENSDSWFDAIERASARIAALSRQGGGPAAVLPPSAVPARERVVPELASVFDLVLRERFADALSLFGALSPTTQEDPDALLLQAVLLTNQGKIAEAERACQRLLQLDELNAGAHYLMALCREHAADAHGAAEHDRIAMHLDATFAMPHLHGGLVAKRAGDRERARRLLADALGLLAREDSSRLVLFGGGFSRDALEKLCRAELALLGGDS